MILEGTNWQALGRQPNLRKKDSTYSFTPDMGNLCRIPKIKRRVSKEGHYHQEDQQRIEWTSQQLIRVLHQLIVALTRIQLQ
jgi:hypothetical protein